MAVLLHISLVAFFSFAIALVATLIAVPFVIRNSARSGHVGKDQNKAGRPSIPELGGIAIVFGLSLGLLVAIALGFNNPALDKYLLLGALSTILFMGLLGIIDDLYVLTKRLKAPMPFLSAVPLSAVRAGTRIIDLPFIGTVNFGSWYPLAVVPIGVGGASNAFNMLAGLNGLEAGMGLVMSFALAVASYLTGATEAFILSASIFGALLAFYYYNRFPARIFPGDVGTYSVGAALAGAAILGNLELFGVVLFVPYFVEFLLKARTRFKLQSFGVPDAKGHLRPPGERNGSLTHMVMRWRPLKEAQVVNVLLLMELAVAVIAVALLPYLR